MARTLLRTLHLNWITTLGVNSMSAALQSGEMKGSLYPADFGSADRQRLVKDAEHRLLWAVLEDGIRGYLENRACTNRKERCEFEEIRRWLEPGKNAAQGPFSFGSICDQLGIDAPRLLGALQSFDGRKAPMLGEKRSHSASLQVLAA